MFLYHHMPALYEFFHYRLVDVSTVKELCRAWNPQVAENVPAKTLTHRGMDDIRESIQELRYYRQTFFHFPK